jgi:hypothetical protein
MNKGGYMEMSRILYLMFMILFIASGVIAGEIFNNPTVGFSIEKPDGWHYLTTQQIDEGKRNIKLNDKELQEAAQKYATAPLVAFSRYQEPYDDINASIKVVFRPLGQLQEVPPTEILKIMVSTIQKAVSDFEFLDKIQPTKVSGLNAAFMRAKYTVSNQENRTFNILTRMVIVPRGAYMFIISMSCKADGTDNSEEMLIASLNSIKIEK